MALQPVTLTPEIGKLTEAVRKGPQNVTVQGIDRITRGKLDSQVTSRLVRINKE
jgi:hypothetical protein